VKSEEQIKEALELLDWLMASQNYKHLLMPDRLSAWTMAMVLKWVVEDNQSVDKLLNVLRSISKCHDN